MATYLVPVPCQVKDDDLLHNDKEDTTSTGDPEKDITEPWVARNEAGGQTQENKEYVLGRPSFAIGRGFADSRQSCEKKEQDSTRSGTKGTMIAHTDFLQCGCGQIGTARLPSVRDKVGRDTRRTDNARTDAILEDQRNSTSQNEQQHRPLPA